MDILDKNIEIAKKIITSEVEKAGYQVDRIILFGSRAKGNFSKDSDYDFFVLTKQDMLHEDENYLLSKLDRLLAELKIDNDIILTSVNKLKKDNNVGNIAYYALKHGVAV